MGARPAKTAQSAAFGPAGRVRGTEDAQAAGDAQAAEGSGAERGAEDTGDERVAGGAEAAQDVRGARGAQDARAAGGAQRAEGARPAGDAGAAGDERRGVPVEGDARGAGKAAPGAWDGGAAAFDDAGAPPPREVRARFARIEATEGAEAAVRYLYELERACGYLNEAAVARTIRWTSDAPCGPLEITINLAKPEKDPRAIAAAYRSAQSACPDSPRGVLPAAPLASAPSSAAASACAAPEVVACAASDAPEAAAPAAGSSAPARSPSEGAEPLGSSLESAPRAAALPASALPVTWRAGDLPAPAASANAAPPAGPLASVASSCLPPVGASSASVDLPPASAPLSAAASGGALFAGVPPASSAPATGSSPAAASASAASPAAAPACGPLVTGSSAGVDLPPSGTPPACVAFSAGASEADASGGTPLADAAAPIASAPSSAVASGNGASDGAPFAAARFPEGAAAPLASAAPATGSSPAAALIGASSASADLLLASAPSSAAVPRRSLSSGPRHAAHEPLCDLCWENEGWPGSANRPAKPGLRIVPVELGGERWGLQFSPYAYFPEHCIALCAEHRPMRVDAAAVARLLDFADRFPFYFIGSNAGLPVVGGSILCHDHFQGGRYEFPLMRASIEQELTLEGLPAVRAGVVDWPASVLRLASPDRASVLAGAERVIAAWERFDDEPAGILSRTDAPHNAVSPILRRLPAAGGWARAGLAEAGVLAGRGAAACAISVAGESLIGGVGALGGAPRVAASGPLPACGSGGPARGGDPSLYVLDLVLRNNRTTPERPFGLFHPDESLFHIKRENIGLIEVMGRAILPPRLARELPVVQQALWDAALSGEAPAALQERLAADPLTAAHAPWAAAVLARRRADLAAEAAARAAAGCAGLDPIAPSPAGSAAEAAPACASSASGPLAPVVRDEVAQVFHQVLQATAVFKPDSAGRRARARFLASLGAHPARS